MSNINSIRITSLPAVRAEQACNESFAMLYEYLIGLADISVLNTLGAIFTGDDVVVFGAYILDYDFKGRFWKFCAINSMVPDIEFDEVRRCYVCENQGMEEWFNS